MNNFDREFQRMSRRHNTMFNVVSSFIGVMWVLILVVLIGAAVLVYKAAGEVSERGLKAVLTELWEGPQGP